MPKFVPFFARLGDTWQVPDDLRDDLDEFACALHGSPRTRSVNELRFMKMRDLYAKDDDRLTCSSTVGMGNLPPCRRSLQQHIRRVNFQVGIWKRAHIANAGTPEANDGDGWALVQGRLEPLWYDGDVLPQQLADIAEDPAKVSDDESDYDDTDSIPDELDYRNRSQIRSKRFVKDISLTLMPLYVRIRLYICF